MSFSEFLIAGVSFCFLIGVIGFMAYKIYKHEKK